MIEEKFQMLDGENTDEYTIRICSMREDENLTWQEVADIINEETDRSYSEKKYRTDYKRFCEGMNKGYEIAKEENDNSSLSQEDAAYDADSYPDLRPRTCIHRTLCSGACLWQQGSGIYLSLHQCLDLYSCDRNILFPVRCADYMPRYSRLSYCSCSFTCRFAGFDDSPRNALRYARYQLHHHRCHSCRNSGIDYLPAQKQCVPHRNNASRLRYTAIDDSFG